MPARTHKSVQHARSALFWAAGAYVALQLTFSLLLDYRWPFIRFPSARVRLEQLAKSHIKPDIVLLGSSRFEAGIIPSEIVWQLERQCQIDGSIGVFKGGLGCGDAIVAEFMFHRLLNAGVQPKLLVLELSPETLNRHNEWLGMHVQRQLRWDDAPHYFADICRSMQAMRWLGERINPVYVHREELCDRTVEKLEQFAGQSAESAVPWTVAVSKPGAVVGGDTISAADPLLPPAPVLAPESMAVSLCGSDQARRWLRNYCIDGGATADALERVLMECKTKKIKVLLVGIPVTQPHRAYYTPEIDREFFAYLDGVTSKYGCRFVNYRDRVPDSLFSDNHHLSPVGGVYFTRLLTFEQLAPFCQSHRLGQDVRTARLH